jgi:pyroglutamyl-peptidase
VLPTDYRKSWAVLRRLYAHFDPDIVVHFGLSGSAEAIVLERLGRRRIAPDKPDAAGYAPRSGRASRSGPEHFAATLPIRDILPALLAAGFPAALSDDAGDYVCNATLYRSLLAAPPFRLVGFVHVPPIGTAGFTSEKLCSAARRIIETALQVWIEDRRGNSVAALAGDLVGCVEGPGDLSTNPKYLADFGK